VVQSGGCGVDQRRDPEGDTRSRRHDEKRIVTSRRTKKMVVLGFDKERKQGLYTK
jgi:hypothetical protein